ncbi:hypothetical protein C0J52_23626 [Blattella germanica]|nr:hypothetical protein C0J52_23626 [Blattella germanica]
MISNNQIDNIFVCTFFNLSMFIFIRCFKIVSYMLQIFYLFTQSYIPAPFFYMLVDELTEV